MGRSRNVYYTMSKITSDSVGNYDWASPCSCEHRCVAASGKKMKAVDDEGRTCAHFCARHGEVTIGNCDHEGGSFSRAFWLDGLCMTCYKPAILMAIRCMFHA